MSKSQIEWTDRVWNPVTGCTKVSEGCRHCYAERVAARFWDGRKFFDIQLHPERLSQPAAWKKPVRVFVNSMSDLFHSDVPEAFIHRVFDAMASCPQHTFQILTKRAARMKLFMTARVEKTGQPPANVWLGVSVENQKAADNRIPHLLATPALIRWLSCEPCLGEIDLASPYTDELFDKCIEEDIATGRIGEFSGGSGGHSWTDGPYNYSHPYEDLLPGIHWVVCGGESGPSARPMDRQWARYLRDQCKDAHVPFFFKQWGEWAPAANGEMVRFGKQVAGGLLDDARHQQYPEVRR